jgi:hypothetical protein
MAGLGLLGACGGLARAHPGPPGGDGAPPDATETDTDAAESGPAETGAADGPLSDADGGFSDADGGFSDGDGGLAEGGDGGPPDADGPVGACTYTCQNPTPVVIAAVDTGYDSCASGSLRRRAQVACPSLLPRPPGGNACLQASDASPPGCRSDAECTGAPYGHCEPATDPTNLTTCGCMFGCTVDSECGDGMVCVCGDPVGHCALASCRTGTSCGESGCDCISTFNCHQQFDCQTPRDVCGSDRDCSTHTDGTTICSEDAGAHVCESQRYCGVGRPFLVAGALRLSPTAARADWRSPCLSPDVRGLSTAERRSLGEHWTHVARMEHASIAAFARFTLHLLALGAPHELVVASNRAMADETEHARLAFALASAFLGREVGPGGLRIDGALDDAGLDAFVATLLREGCIGEARAAVEARELLEVTSDAATRNVLAIIAADETRHAELAWRTLGWLLASGRVRTPDVHAELDRAVSEMATEDRDVASRIIGPCADAVLLRAA